MPSTVPRRLLEHALRVGGLVLLAVLLWRAIPRERAAGSRAPARVTLAAADSAPGRVARALLAAARGEVATSGTSAPGIAAVRVEARSLSSEAARGALAALRHAGSIVSWHDASAARGLAVSAVALPDPAGARAVTASVDSARPGLVLADDAGVLDSGTTTAGAGRVVARRIAGTARARAGASWASVVPDAAPSPRRVLLYARPGWEGKFTVAALEEAGWSVDGSYAIAPRVAVAVGQPRPLDTARYGVAVVLDSGVANAAALSRFAANGGGVIVAGDGVRDRALARLLPALPRDLRPAVPGALLTGSPLQGLELVGLAPGADAVVLARDAGDRGAPAIVVQRRGSGRVLATGYRESWRWRMEGDADAPSAHRRWWSALARTVAYAPVPAASTGDSIASASSDTNSGTSPGAYPGSAAPYADLVARLGPPSPAPAAASSRPSLVGTSDTVLLALALLAFVMEWALRRLRGAR